MMRVLDLFSAAAGGWSLGMHRAGFTTVAACEFIPWRRALYSQNNPDVRMYDDVRTLTGRQLLSDLGFLPDAIVGSPPCQDISSANTKGKGVEGERSGLFFEAVRLIGEVRPRWFALENSANLRTRGADAVIAALEAIGYTCWPFVVSAADLGANHERKRSWLIGCDLEQVADPKSIRRVARAGNSQSQFGRGNRGVVGDGANNGQIAHANGIGRDAGREGRRGREYVPVQDDPQHAAGLGHEGGRARRHGPDGHGSPPVAEGSRDAADADQEGQEDGCLVPSVRQAEISNDGCRLERSDDGSSPRQMGLRPGDSADIAGGRVDWSLANLADHIRLDDGLSTWMAQSRVAVGGPLGTSAASLTVEAFGDSVIPQIPEAIGRAILRTEAALAAVLA